MFHVHVYVHLVSQQLHVASHVHVFSYVCTVADWVQSRVCKLHTQVLKVAHIKCVVVLHSPRVHKSTFRICHSVTVHACDYHATRMCCEVIFEEYRILISRMYIDL